MATFIIYRVAIVNKAKEEQSLSNFNGQNDLLEVCNQYYHSLRKNRREYYDNQGKKRTFSINTKIDFLRTDRTLITRFDSAFTGNEVYIRNAETNSLNYKVNKDELQSLSLFSLCHIPKKSKYGYVVFENKANHGVKVAFERGFQSFLNASGYEDYRVVMTPALNYNYLSNFIVNGKLKKLRLIENTLKKDVQLSLWNDLDRNCKDKDIRELKFRSKTENSIYKKELHNLFFTKMNEYEKIQFMNTYVIDDISFEINYKGASKVFYMKDRGRMRAIVDVSSQLMYEEGQPTYDSMVKTSIKLINEILGYDLLDFNNAA